MNKFKNNKSDNWKLIILSLLAVFQMSAQSNDVKDYLKGNSLPLEEKTDTSLYINKDVLFIGEIHNKIGNYDICYRSVKNILRYTDKCILIVEFPFYFEKKINDFLKTGSDETLKLILEPVIFKDEYSVFIKKMFLLQTGNKKIEVKCIDIPSNRQCAIVTLVDLLPRLMYPYSDSLKSFYFLERLGQKKHYRKKKALKVIATIEAECKKYNDTFRLYLGGNYDEFIHQVMAAKIMFDSLNDPSSKGLEKREQYLYENLRKIILQNPDIPIFAQFGRAHIPITYQTRWIHLHNWKSLAARLNTNEDSPVKGKVGSIPIFYTSEIKDAYKDEKFYMPIIKKEDLPLFLEYCKTPLTIFNLNNENSPFSDMTNKFQYLIINKY